MSTSPIQHLVPKLVAVLLVQLALVGAAVAPQLSARTMGEEYLFTVAPYDPIDPFRGAYVDLTYPDLALNQPTGDPAAVDADDSGRVYVTLREENGLWVANGYLTDRPSEGPYLTCDNHGFRFSCGIESYFLPQRDAAAFQSMINDGTAVARVRIDSRGNASLMAVERR